MVRGVEPAGFEIRDQIVQLYLTGVPKSMDVSGAIDARLGAVRADHVVEVSDHDTLLGRTTKVLNSGQWECSESRRTGLNHQARRIEVGASPAPGRAASRTAFPITRANHTRARSRRQRRRAAGGKAHPGSEH